MAGPVVEGIAAVLNMFLSMIQLLVLASVIVSWIGDRSNTIVQMIYTITEPIYRPIRRYSRRIPGPIDWAPMIILAIVIFLQVALVGGLRNYAGQLKYQAINSPEEVGS